MIKKRWFAYAPLFVSISAWAGMSRYDLMGPLDYPVVIVATVTAIYGQSPTNASPPTFSIRVSQKLKSGKIPEFLEAVLVTWNDIDYVGGDSEERQKEWGAKPLGAFPVNSSWIFCGEFDKNGRLGIIRSMAYSEKNVTTLKAQITEIEKSSRLSKIKPTDASLSLKPGATGTFSFRVKNDGHSKGIYSVRVSGTLRHWITKNATPKTISIESGETKTISISVTVPKNTRLAKPGSLYFARLTVDRPNRVYSSYRDESEASFSIRVIAK